MAAHKKSLNEVKGVFKDTSINKNSIQIILKNRAKRYSVSTYVAEIKKGNIAFLSKAITLVESTAEKHQQKAAQILEQCLPFANQSVRIGITGVPGVGKSTFIEAYGKQLTDAGKKVAVLAVDPSSSVNKGSILGDKTRMEALVKNPNAYIRPSASGDTLGGVAQKTRESIVLCEAAGFDTILIETVGVGQSETLVHSMVDFFLLLKLAGAGDELQGIKRGIIEMADAIIINKADGDNLNASKLAKVAFTNALHLYPPKASKWQPKVLRVSALNNNGITEVNALVNSYFKLTKTNNYFNKNRQEQQKYWLLATIDAQLKASFYNNPTIKNELNTALNEVYKGKTTPFLAAKKLLKKQ